jgi:hypothetical protein
MAEERMKLGVRTVLGVVLLPACIGARALATPPKDGSGSSSPTSGSQVGTNAQGGAQGSAGAGGSGVLDNPPDDDDDVGMATGEPASTTWGIVPPDARKPTRPQRPQDTHPEYAQVVSAVARMVHDGELVGRVRRRGLSVVNVAWEDTGRSQGSSVGPNISDVTLQVHRQDRGAYRSAIMPVIRPPNFVDRTGDIPSDRFFVRIGNHERGSLRSVPLVDVLRNLSDFVTDVDSVGGTSNLFSSRDSHFLVSAQAVFLPVPAQGKIEFNPVVFNYQSAPGSPAVLTLLVTREGTSVRVIENRNEDFTSAGWGQELYFNDRGQKSAFTAERRSDVKARIEAQGGPRDEAEKSALESGADVMFLVQVPLVHAEQRRKAMPMEDSMMAPASPSSMGAGAAAAESKGSTAPRARPRSDVENAVLGHGPHLGPYREGYGRRLVRDTRFPVRVTVQFYKATSNGVVSDRDLDLISKTIGSVYEHADYVGSLVLPAGDPRRPTAWQRMPREWFPW